MTRGPAAVGLAALACTLVAACTPSTTVSGDAPPSDTAMTATVERVVDGDTVILAINGVRERARLLRIDTPERARDGSPAECLAEEAARALARLLPTGETVLVTTDVEARDRYGRLLVHVWRDGVWVNTRMLREGWAQVVTFPPNTAHDDEVLAAQETARQAAAGLWAPDVCG